MTEFKIGDRVRINARHRVDTALEPALGRAGVVNRVDSEGQGLWVEVEGAALTAYGQTKNEWWFPRSGLALIKEETKEEEAVTFNEGDKVRILPGGSYGGVDGEGVIEFGPDEDNDYYIDGVGYVAAEFLAPFEEFPRPIEFAEVKVGDRISARHAAQNETFVTYEDTVQTVESDGLYGKSWYIDEGMDYTITLLNRPEDRFFSVAQTDAIEALVKAGFSQESAEAIVKKGDSA